MTLTVGIIGQSNAAKWVDVGTDLTANASLTLWNGASFVSPGTTGNGQISFGNDMISAFAEPVRMINSAVGSTALLQVADGGAGYWLDIAALSLYDDFKTDVTAAVGGLNLDLIIWVQGERDAAFGSGEDDYYDGLLTFFSRIRTDFGDANLPIVMAGLGRSIGGSDVNHQAIRRAQKRISLPNTNLMATSIDLPLVDTVHYTDAGYITHGQRAALAARSLLGQSVSFRGQSITRVSSFSSTQTDITLSPSSNFTPSSAITGFELSDNYFTSTLAITVDKLNNSTIRLTHAAAANDRQSRYLYGSNPAVTNPVYNSDSLPLEWSEMGTMVDFIGLHYLDAAAGDLTVTSGIPAGNALTSPTQKLYLASGNEIVTKLGFSGRSDSGSNPRTMQLFLLESTAANFTSMNVVAEVTGIAVPAGNQAGDILPYDKVLDGGDFVLVSGRYYAVGTNRAVAAEGVAISTSKSADNGGTSFTVSLDNLFGDETIAATYVETSTSGDNGRVAWAEFTIPTTAPTLTTPYSSTIYQVANAAPREGASVYAHLNPNNTIAEATATDWFDGVTQYEIRAGDIMWVQMSDGFTTLSFTTPTTAEIA